MAISNGSVFGQAIIGAGGGGGLYPSNTAQQGYSWNQYERERQMEYARYQEAQMHRMMNQQPVFPKEAPKPKAPDPLGFLNKADNKLLLTTGALE